MPDRQLTRLRGDRVGFMFQAFNLLPVLSAAGNITLPLDIAGRDPDPDWLATVVETVGLADRLTHRPGRTVRRAAAAGRDRPGAGRRPAIVFADEPTGNLDSRAGAEVLDLLRRCVGRVRPDRGDGDPRPGSGLLLPSGSCSSPTDGWSAPSTSRRQGRCWTGCARSASRSSRRAEVAPGRPGRPERGVSPMFAATFRSLLAHRVRLALTALAIALGTGFMAGSFVFTATLTHSLDSLFAQAATGTDVDRPAHHPARRGLRRGQRGSQPVPAAIVTAIRRLPGVAAADGAVSGRAVLLGRNGRPLPGQFGVALSWPADPRSRPSSPAGPGAADRAGPGHDRLGSARQGRFTVGDRIEVAIGGQARPFTVTGITGYGSADSIGGGSMAIFSLPTAQQLFGLAGQYSQIDVKAGPRRARPAIARPGGPDPPGRRAGGHRGERCGHPGAATEQPARLPHLLLRRLRGRVAAGRRVRDLEHLLDHDRPADAGSLRCCAPWAPGAARCSAACWARPRCSAPSRQPRGGSARHRAGPRPGRPAVRVRLSLPVSGSRGAAGRSGRVVGRRRGDHGGRGGPARVARH